MRVNPPTCCCGTACDSALAFSQCSLMAADRILFEGGKTASVAGLYPKELVSMQAIGEGWFFLDGGNFLSSS